MQGLDLILKVNIFPGPKLHWGFAKYLAWIFGLYHLPIPFLDKEILIVVEFYIVFLFIWIFFHKHSRVTGQQKKDKAISL